VRAYALRDGRAESIMDPETGLINAVDFDAVAARLTAEFDELLELGTWRPSAARPGVSRGAHQRTGAVRPGGTAAG
jgi:hypothetical protein